MTKSGYIKLTLALITAWFIAAVIASASRVFENNNARLGLSVAFAALTPIVLFALWFATSTGFREFTRSLDPRLLTILQTWRIGGLVFVVLYEFGILPGIFAMPAGLGDMAIGATAPLVAWNLTQPGHRNRFILWQALGMLDLVRSRFPGHDGALDQPELSVRCCHDRAAPELDPDFHRAVADDLPRDLH